MKDESNSPLAENQNNVEGHLEAASVHHIKAISFLKEGNYEKAAENAVLAQDHLNLASEVKRKDMNSNL
jgi:hypothetical protein